MTGSQDADEDGSQNLSVKEASWHFLGYLADSDEECPTTSLGILVVGNGFPKNLQHASSLKILQRWLQISQENDRVSNIQ